MATVVGLEFAAAFLLAPTRGLVAVARRRARQRLGFAETMLAIHLLHHEGTADAAAENRREHLREHLRWDDEFAERIVRRARRHGLVAESDGRLALTERGRAVAADALATT